MFTLIMQALSKFVDEIIDKEIEREYKRKQLRWKLTELETNLLRLDDSRRDLIAWMGMFEIDWKERTIKAETYSYEMYLELYKRYYGFHCTLHGVDSSPEIKRLRKVDL